MSNRTIVVIAGPTAVGKTEYAIEIAKRINGEIISCDSMQLYKYMDIGSAKPTKEQMAEVKHYLIDMIDPGEEFSVAMYQKLAKEAIEEVFSGGKVPIIAGGTGLYLNSLIFDMDFSAPPGDGPFNQFRQELYDLAEAEGNEALYDKLKALDAEKAKEIHPNNVKKVVRAIEALKLGSAVKPLSSLETKTSDYDVILICLTRDREELYNRINRRVDILVDLGLVSEVNALKSQNLCSENISMKGIGYKEILAYLEGEYTLERAIELIKRNTRRFAKRQLTWFRRYDDMQWFNLSNYKDENTALEEVLQWLFQKLQKK